MTHWSRDDPYIHVLTDERLPLTQEFRGLDDQARFLVSTSVFVHGPDVRSKIVRGKDFGLTEDGGFEIRLGEKGNWILTRIKGDIRVQCEKERRVLRIPLVYWEDLKEGICEELAPNTRVRIIEKSSGQCITLRLPDFGYDNQHENIRTLHARPLDGIPDPWESSYAQQIFFEQLYQCIKFGDPIRAVIDRHDLGLNCAIVVVYVRESTWFTLRLRHGDGQISTDDCDTISSVIAVSPGTTITVKDDEGNQAKLYLPRIDQVISIMQHIADSQRDDNGIGLSYLEKFLIYRHEKPALDGQEDRMQIFYNLGSDATIRDSLGRFIPRGGRLIIYPGDRFTFDGFPIHFPPPRQEDDLAIITRFLSAVSVGDKVIIGRQEREGVRFEEGTYVLGLSGLSPLIDEERQLAVVKMAGGYLLEGLSAEIYSAQIYARKPGMLPDEVNPFEIVPPGTIVDLHPDSGAAITLPPIENSKDQYRNSKLLTHNDGLLTTVRLTPEFGRYLYLRWLADKRCAFATFGPEDLGLNTGLTIAIGDEGEPYYYFHRVGCHHDDENMKPVTDNPIALKFGEEDIQLRLELPPFKAAMELQTVLSQLQKTGNATNQPMHGLLIEERGGRIVLHNIDSLHEISNRYHEKIEPGVIYRIPNGGCFYIDELRVNLPYDMTTVEDRLKGLELDQRIAVGKFVGNQITGHGESFSDLIVIKCDGGYRLTEGDTRFIYDSVFVRIPGSNGLIRFQKDIVYPSGTEVRFGLDQILVFMLP